MLKQKDTTPKIRETISKRQKQNKSPGQKPSKGTRASGKKETPVSTLPGEDLKSIPDVIQDAFFTVDREWRITFINQKASELTGLKPEESVGKELWKLWPRYLRTPTEHLFRQAMEQRIPIQGSFQGLYTHRQYEARIYPSGKGISAFLLDKTEIYQQEQELQQGRQQLTGFLESTHDSFFSLDRKWRILYTNRRFGELVKKAPSDLVGRNFWKEFPKYRGTEVEKNYRRAMEAGLPVQFEAVGFYTEGWYEITAYPTPEGISVFSSDRSEEKRALERLRQSEERLRELNQDLELRNAQLEAERRRWRGIVGGIAEEVWVCDLQGQMSLINLGEATSMGLEEFENKPVEEILQEVEILTPDGKVRPVDQSPLLLSLTGPIVRGEEIMRHRKSGKMRYRQFSSAPTRDEAGTITGAVAVVLDVTHIKEAQRNLEQAHQRTFEILESIGDAFYHLDRNWCFAYINKHSEDLWHIRREDLLGKNIWEVFPQAVGSETYRAHLQAVEEQRPIHLETVSSIIDSWITLSLYPMQDGLSVYFRDISQQKQVEESRRFSEEKFSLAFANNPAALELSSLEDGLFVDVNETWERLMGYTRTEAIGQAALILPMWPTPEERARFVQELKSTGSLRWPEQEFLKKTGESFFVELSAQVLTINNREMVLSTFIDITERKRYQMELKEFAEKLQRSNQELQEFAYVASHDLQEPLRKVVAFGDNLFRKLSPSLPEHDRDEFDRMIQATRRMQDMINDLLELSQVTTQGLPFQEVDLRKVANDVLVDLEVTLAKTGGQVQIGNLPTVKGDPIQIHRLLMNLIGNGLKYHRAGVPPSVEVKGRKFKDQGVQTAEIKVEDNGIGFEMQYAERIFQPFNRLNSRSEYEGTGMGLAICKRIVERHGGKISAQSEPGHGATFTILLPLD